MKMLNGLGLLLKLLSRVGRVEAAKAKLKVESSLFKNPSVLRGVSGATFVLRKSSYADSR